MQDTGCLWRSCRLIPISCCALRTSLNEALKVAERVPKKPVTAAPESQQKTQQTPGRERELLVATVRVERDTPTAT